MADALEGDLVILSGRLREAAQPVGNFLRRYGPVLQGKWTELRPDLDEWLSQDDIPKVIRRALGR